MAAQETPTEQRSGLLYGFGAYGLWGLLPLYWHALSATGSLEVLAHRMLWSLPTALVILTLLRRWSWIRPLLRQPRKLALIALGSALIALNWGLFIWSVETGRVLESSLGYFINPLVSIGFGVLLLRERLRTAQWAAVGVGALAVAVMTFAYGRLPWLSLTLAFTFATYGLIKKRVALDGVEGFSAETVVQFLPAVAFLAVVGARGDSGFTAEGPVHALLLALSGLATALPLIFFGAAAVRLPLSTIGLLQYTTPASMFLLGVFAFHEDMPPERLAGFALVWLALTILTWDALRTARRGRARLRAARAAAATTPPTPTPLAPTEEAAPASPTPPGPTATPN
ncbi:EamA family transporter RarD [Streptomyces sp. AJS327]|uniref:EamA family transporter RarD n=1 Tax=Streptomyces sp. AJS327 TaxID=2545265 RepID=UPI0015E02F59|nr:EamA family transporter RarD [Streptomyces sp. AJS327]MBA0054057.1 EamA family transporter RarD [Streptomyces sp. AJS327]